MDGRGHRLTRKQRRELRALERDLERDAWLNQAFAGLPKLPLLLRISPAVYMTMGVLTMVFGTFTGQGLSFMVGLACIGYGIMRHRDPAVTWPPDVDDSPRRQIDPRERER